MPGWGRGEAGGDACSPNAIRFSEEEFDLFAYKQLQIKSKPLTAEAQFKEFLKFESEEL